MITKGYGSNMVITRGLGSLEVVYLRVMREVLRAISSITKFVNLSSKVKR